MPLDSSTYALAHLRVDGRRWNELRRLHGQMSTQAAADGSSYLEMGNTKVICTIHGPKQDTRGAAGGGQSGSGGGREGAAIEVELSVAGFSGMDRRKRSRMDKRTQEAQHTIASAFQPTLFTSLYPHSTIGITLHVLSQDGSLLAACINAATLALIDAGIPMRDYVAACTTGSAAYAVAGSEGEDADPLLDLNGAEEVELPFLTIASPGAGGAEQGKVTALVMETRVQMARLEGMIAVALDGCAQIRMILDGIVRAHGKRMVQMRGAGK